MIFPSQVNFLLSASWVYGSESDANIFVDVHLTNLEI